MPSSPGSPTCSLQRSSPPTGSRLSSRNSRPPRLQAPSCESKWTGLSTAWDWRGTYAVTIARPWRLCARDCFPPPSVCLGTTPLCLGKELLLDRVANDHGVPFRSIQVSQPPDEGPAEDTAVLAVAQQLQDVHNEIGDFCGRLSRLEEAVDLSNRARSAWRDLTEARLRGEILLDGRGAFSFAFLGQMLWGTVEGADGYEMLLEPRRRRDLTVKGDGHKRLMWLHTLPHHNPELFSFISSRGAVVAFEEMCRPYEGSLDPRDPFPGMARRLLEHPLWGTASRRARLVRDTALETGIHGVVHFNQWGCRHGLGTVPVLKEVLGKAGIPFLALDGDALEKRAATAAPSSWRSSWRCSERTSPWKRTASPAPGQVFRYALLGGAMRLAETVAERRNHPKMPDHDTERTLAVFIDFENLAIGFEKRRGEFDISKILERLLEKGKIIVKKAYADWGQYSKYTRDLHEAAIELIEIPRRRMTGKNSADIRLAVEAMHLAWSKEHINTFVIVSGDSDFSPLVSKLKENGRHVIGIGMKDSTSDLLAENCDEFLFYEDLEKTADAAPAKIGDDIPKAKRQIFDLLFESVAALQRENKDPIFASMVKDTMQRKRPSFSESGYGYRSFSDFLEDAQKRGYLRLRPDRKAGGTYVVEGFK